MLFNELYSCSATVVGAVSIATSGQPELTKLQARSARAQASGSTARRRMFVTDARRSGSIHAQSNHSLARRACIGIPTRLRRIAAGSHNHGSVRPESEYYLKRSASMSTSSGSVSGIGSELNRSSESLSAWGTEATPSSSSSSKISASGTSTGA